MRTSTIRYLYLISADVWGGAEKNMADYWAGASGSACSITWGVTKDIFSDYFKARSAPITVVELPAASGRSRPYAFYRFLTSCRPDVIVASQKWLSSFKLWELAVASIVARGQLYLVVHDCPPPPTRTSKMHFGFIPGLGFHWRKQRLKSKLLAYLPKHILALSNTIKQHLVRQFDFPAAKITTVRVGVDLDKFKPSLDTRSRVRRQYNIKDTDRVVVSVSRLHRIKRVDSLIEAFGIRARERDDLWLIIAGDGPEKDKLTKAANALDEGIRRRIIFAGFMEDVVPVLQAADIFALSSESEGFPNACLEAMACGVVVVATRCGGPEEQIIDGADGFLVEKSTQGIAEGLHTVLNLGDRERKAIVENARKSVASNFDIKDTIRDFLSIMEIDRP